ncbi:UDP-glycosyltransferase UGT5-like [Palaemon carinicauda]|uniref:UDP-glycosyltransferase UGT5-like n=1 Tax=Palaemon carinicauda TaxID=392227 RepID=UPI0035B697A8
MWRAQHLLLLMAVSLFVLGSDGYRVLVVGILGTRSHTHFYSAIAKQLADSGHQVTYVSAYSSQEAKTNVNIREVWLPEVSVSLLNQNRFNTSTVGFLLQLKKLTPMCIESLRNSQVQELFQEKFDVILLSPFNDCYLSLVYQLQIPFIYLYPVGMTSTLAEIVGNPSFPAFVTPQIFDYSHPLTFGQRTQNALVEVVSPSISKYGYNNQMEQECRSSGLCPADMPPFVEIQQNVSLAFVNSVRELETPAIPYVPAVVHLGGIHCQPAKPLPKDLDNWAEASGDDGFIFFSLGTAVRSVDLPESHRQVLIKTFGSLKQRVLWKWDDESIPGMPPNVRVEKWLPQQDILGHPKLRLFITHGGLLSIFESVYHGRPLLGIPVMGDQKGNMMTVERQGWGKTLLWEDLVEERLLEEILFVMNNKTMHEEARMRSRLMKDQPRTPKDLALFWTEYVIRHKGAAHLKCPIAQMPWYILYNADVWLMLVTSCVLIMWLLCWTLLGIIRFFFSKFKIKKD